jgi:hypothetical protein
VLWRLLGISGAGSRIDGEALAPHARGMIPVALTPAEHALLREVRVADEDHGGLGGDQLGDEEWEALEKLCALGLVEAVGEYGEAPDGEEDEREAGARDLAYRITGAGVLVLLEAEA